MNDLPAYCLELARRAQAAAADLAQAGGGQKQRWLRAAARLLGERSAALAEANGLDLAAAASSGLDRAPDRPPEAQSRADCGHAGGPGAGGRPAGTDRRSDLLVDSAQRAGGAEGPRAAGGDLHHLRVAAERDHRRGGDLRQERQRRDPARRQGGGPFQRGPGAKSSPRRPPRRACRRRPCSWWPRRTGPPSDTCCTCPSTSTSPFPAAARS